MPDETLPKLNDNLTTPLYQVVGNVAALWTLAMFGYYIIFPALKIPLEYSAAPVPIALYFLICAVLSVWTFSDLFKKWLEIDWHIWLWGGISLGFAGLVWLFINILASLPAIYGPIFTPYTDILLGTPRYFLPKAVEVLIQQVLITALVLALYFRMHSVKKVMLAYIVIFGGAHVILFLLSKAPTPYAVLMTLGAVFSAFVFPHIIIKVRGGFLYNYIIHLGFYIALALILHTWPPSGYYGM